MEVVVSRPEVYLVRFDPTVGREMRKTRPAVVVSPDEMNHHLGTVTVAPLTTGGPGAPWRIKSRFAGKEGAVALDHLRTVDKTRLVKRLGTLDRETASAVQATLVAMFGA